MRRSSCVVLPSSEEISLIWPRLFAPRTAPPVDSRAVCCTLRGSKPDGNHECTLRWLTNDALQRLTHSRHETSSSSTDDDLDGSDFVEKGAR